MTAQAQAELFEPAQYIGQGGSGYFSLSGRPEGRWQEHAYPIPSLAVVVEGVNPYLDTWISQATFDLPRRKVINLQSVGLLFVDLDTYRVADLRGKTAEGQTAELLLRCDGLGIPRPSVVLFSGRGLQPKWLLTQAVRRVDVMAWNAAERALVRLLAPFGADPQAKDAARVLRLDRTINTKSGERCRVVHVTGTAACPARYDFGELRETLVGLAPEVLPRDRPDGARILALPASEGIRRLNWTRLEDLRRLWRLRGGVREGFRELTLFWQLVFLLRAEPGRAEDLWNEAQGLAAQIDSGWFTREIDRGTFTTLYRKAQEGRQGLLVTFQGRTYPPMYTPRNQTLLDLFSITPAEEMELRTIISKAEKYRRRVEKRRAAGIVDRSTYLAQSVEAAKPWEAAGIKRSLWYERHPAGRSVDRSVLTLGGGALSQLSAGSAGGGKPALPEAVVLGSVAPAVLTLGGGSPLQPAAGVVEPLSVAWDSRPWLSGGAVAPPVGSAAAAVELQVVGRRFDVECRRCGRPISLLRVPSGWVTVERGGNVRHAMCRRKKGG